MLIAVCACTPGALVTKEPFQVGNDDSATGSPIETTSGSDNKTYTNDEFVLRFSFPADWYGPEEYVSEDTLRVEIGSDKVYPYGSDPESRVYNGTNSYSIVLQYTRNNQNDFWQEPYQQLLALEDSESISDTRSLNIRVSQITLGDFQGLEYISTLSETAQTDPVYIRQIYLVDDQNNLISIMGSPVNVTLNPGEDWRSLYTRIDEANLDTYHEVLESITFNN